MRTVLVAPPWNSLYRPSIQIATLGGLAAQGTGDPITCEYAYLDWFEYVIGVSDRAPEQFIAIYDTIGEELYGLGVGDWIFGSMVAPEDADEAAVREEYAAFLGERGVAPDLVSFVMSMRQEAAGFVTAFADSLLATGAECFGFTTSFSQLIPALAIARALKDRAPERFVFLGGANCDRPMGEAVMRSYRFVDAVVQGEGEAAVTAISEAGTVAELKSAPGMVLRDGEDLVVSPPVVQSMEATPVPRYDEYFERLERFPWRDLIVPNVALPFQMSRGCWWGEKMQCTFCGENGSGMPYRSRAGTQLVHALRELTERHGVLDTYAVDTILAKDDNGLAALAEAEVDVTTFFEVKANLSPKALGELRAAGVTMVQPGIESLSTGSLKLLRKGATGFHNLRFLVLCRELGIDARWNLLSAMPGETPEMLDEQLRLIPFLPHLAPPSTVSKVRVDRYSPYFENPGEFGIELTGPERKYRFTHPGHDAEREAMAYSFDHAEVGDAGGESMLALRRRLGARVGLWKKLHGQSRFNYRFGPDLTVLFDHRPQVGRGRHVLRGWEDVLFRALVHGGRVNQAVDHAAERARSESEVRDRLREWQECGWVYSEGPRGLVLAVHDSGRDELGRAVALGGRSATA
ncbi:RiPP maturation radical SAM C-methyltransferase [Saccharopolyspora sp. NFXS83]|uniref:RiPP maturation radical SAM C-methyltransferase n=1 Tax=Saccharopolyspora sp. NFXS83 TaxID=2993560 RepID=UPI00224B727A|nr:RiPP maturation radical SAM C-methyltransferase [Saccharopolyspora sp. NFXS83]MCX2729185.1 RiPP maturation radical SAM C-methyltransferase [Saccharopolyspora sp. NFXS83]